MRALTQHFADLKKLRQWGTFLSGSVLSQGLAALTGLLIVRWMTLEDYAIYTITTVVLGTITLLTKGGTHLGFAAIVGRTWPDRMHAASALDAALRQRRLISAVILPVLTPIAVWLLVRNGARGSVIATLLCLLTIYWFADMRTRLVDQILFFAGRASRTQVLDTALSAIRLTLVSGLHHLGVLGATTAMAAAAGVALIRVPFIERWTLRETPFKTAIKNDAYFSEIRKITIRQFPLEVFSCVQAQLIFLVIAWIGLPTQTAEFGALSRITQLLLPVQAFIQAFAIPSFSRTKQHVGLALCRWILIGLLPSAALLLSSLIAPSAFLWLIGPQYGALKSELVICALGVAANSVGSIALQLIGHRGWNIWAWLQIPTTLAWCLIGLTVFDFSKITGVLWLQVGFALGPLSAFAGDILAAHRRGEFSTQAPVK
ncbi:hypothetical protein [Bradyrhizobium vignae]|uniref:Polysaccharide biosynthesis protein n=1 Tax=Bradyrhizobium vignae TaxID=1549949 RepID=A0A2U3Q8L7_9BRAD|nr:hypothetical protein [Bradyrhizobium vignae]SPP97727.1 conserved membrane protein of unknown function [Bradyrhizobium vignae]